MTVYDPVTAIQDGLVNLLVSDAEIGQYVTGVLTEMPDAASSHYPCIVVADLTSAPDGTHDDPGRVTTVRIQVLARGDLNDRNIALRVAARVVALTDSQHSALDAFVSGHTVWMIRHIETRRIPSDPQTRRMMVQIDIWTTNT